MQKLIRLTSILINYLIFQATSLSFAYAQDATPSAETTTSSTLPDAGTFETTLLLLVFGVGLIVLGSYLILRHNRRFVS